MIRCVFFERALLKESREPAERSKVQLSGGVTTILKWTREQATLLVAWRMEGCGHLSLLGPGVEGIVRLPECITDGTG